MTEIVVYTKIARMAHSMVLSLRPGLASKCLKAKFLWLWPWDLCAWPCASASAEYSLACSSSGLENRTDSFWHHPQTQGPTTTVKVKSKVITMR